MPRIAETSILRPIGFAKQTNSSAVRVDFGERPCVNAWTRFRFFISFWSGAFIRPMPRSVWPARHAFRMVCLAMGSHPGWLQGPFMRTVRLHGTSDCGCFLSCIRKAATTAHDTSLPSSFSVTTRGPEKSLFNMLNDHSSSGAVMRFTITAGQMASAAAVAHITLWAGSCCDRWARKRIAPCLRATFVLAPCLPQDSIGAWCF